MGATRLEARLTGLSAAEATARLMADGPNELPRPGKRSISRIIVDVAREPMFALLLGAGAIYLVLGSLDEALLLLGFAAISVTIAVVQQSRSARVLDALRDLSSPRALVIRDGASMRIPGRDVVRGDVIVLTEGVRIAADAVLLSSQDLETDESLLTGESVAVRKVVGEAPPSARPGGDDLPFVFSGTLVVRGQGLARVLATGARTELGRIGVALGTIEREPTRLDLQNRRLVRVAALVGAGLSAAAVLLYGWLRGSWLDGLLGGVALSMSLMPEEFPLVLTVFMVMGAWRLSRARVLTRRAATIEMLGAATVLCTDKTGTLTQNRMALAELRAGAAVFRPGESPDTDLSPPIRAVIDHGILASAERPFDPMEQAFHAFGRNRLARQPSADGWRLVRTFGLSADLLAMSQIWSVGEGTRHVIACKGAPEAVAALCRLDPAERGELGRTVDAMAAAGMRVLGIAGAELDRADLPASQRDVAFRFLGLAGLSDPLRPGVPEAVRECGTAGIRVVMITGDYPATALAIAKQAGLVEGGALLTGADLAELSSDALRRRVATTTVYARIMPEQKLRIVEALKANGEVVAMTGDGVNDAPSLKAAHIGIAMGGRGTDVARESASIVLLDDDFGSIVRTVRMGRRIYDNLGKAFGYILAVHVPIAGVALLPFAFGWPLILGPVHIAFLEMVIDPVCSIVFEAEREEADVMRRPPRDPASLLLSPMLAGWGLLQGLAALVALAAVFLVTAARGMPEDEARALVFTSLVLTNIGLVLVNRSFSAAVGAAFRGVGPVLWLIVGLAGASLAAGVTWAPAQALFRFGPLQPVDIAISFAVTVALLIVLECAKPAWRRCLSSERQPIRTV